jgi:hypothetical protein
MTSDRFRFACVGLFGVWRNVFHDVVLSSSS